MKIYLSISEKKICVLNDLIKKDYNYLIIIYHAIKYVSNVLNINIIFMLFKASYK